MITVRGSPGHCVEQLISGCLLLRNRIHIRLCQILITYWLLIVSALLCVACDNRKDNQGISGPDQENTAHINPKKLSQISFFKHFEVIDIIPLQTNSSSIISYVDKILFLNDIYYIMDSRQATLFLFDVNGRFIDKILRRGNGPGEYPDIYDFDVNRFTGNIELLNPRGKLLVYSPALEYIETIDINQRAAHQFFNMNSDTIVFYTYGEKEKLSFYSRSAQRIIHKDFTFDSLDKLNLYPSMSYNNVFHYYKGRVLFEVPYSYTIYDITDCKLLAHHTWDFGKYNFNPKNIDKEGDEGYHFRYYMNLKNEVFNLNYYYETDQIIFTRYEFNDTYYTLLYDKLSNKYDIVDRYDEGVHGVVIFTDIHEDVFLRIMKLDKTSLGKHFDVLNDVQKSVLETIEPEDNVGILKYRITYGKQ